MQAKFETKTLTTGSGREGNADTCKVSICGTACALRRDAGLIWATGGGRGRGSYR